MEKLLNVLFACHRLPNRSFFYKGRQFPICARCSGILIGYFLGLIYFLLFGSIPLIYAVIILIPLIIDGGIQYINKLESTNLRRFITGLLAGVGTDFIIYGIILLGFNHGQNIVRYILNTN